MDPWLGNYLLLFEAHSGELVLSKENFCFKTQFVLFELKYLLGKKDPLRRIFLQKKLPGLGLALGALLGKGCYLGFKFFRCW